MFKLGKPVFAAAALFAAFLTFSASAEGGGNGNGGGNGHGHGYGNGNGGGNGSGGNGGGNGGQTIGAPGPVAGVGLIGVVVAGGVTYLIGRRRRKPGQD